MCEERVVRCEVRARLSMCRVAGSHWEVVGGGSPEQNFMSFFLLFFFVRERENLKVIVLKAKTRILVEHFFFRFILFCFWASHAPNVKRTWFFLLNSVRVRERHAHVGTCAFQSLYFFQFSYKICPRFHLGFFFFFL